MLLAIDQKHLIKIYSDRTLEEVKNTRLFHLKQRILPWYFQIIHLPSKTNFGPNTTSHQPSPVTEIDKPQQGCLLESTIAATIPNDAHTLASVTWDQLIEETSKDDQLRALQEAI